MLLLVNKKHISFLFRFWQYICFFGMMPLNDLPDGIMLFVSSLQRRHA